MTPRVFVDTSAWMAVVDASDARHALAAQTYLRLLKSPIGLVTTLLVVAETQIWLRRRASAEAAFAFLENVNESQRIEVIYPDDRLEIEAKRLLRRYADQDFSFTDAISFACMERHGLTEAFTYDRHFAMAGYTIISELDLE